MRALLCLTLALTGCDSDSSDDNDTQESDLAVGCAHFEHGPHHEDFAAGEAGTGTAIAPHNHYFVKVEGEANQLAMTPPAAGTYIFMLGDAAASVTVEHEGTEVAAAKSEDPGHECAAAKSALHYALEEKAYTVTVSGEVELVVHGPVSGGHEHNAHEH